MVYKVIWSALAIETYISNIEYLQSAWTVKERNRFIAMVKRRIELISSDPQLVVLTNKGKNVRKPVVHLRVVLFFRVKAEKREVELIRFWPSVRTSKRLKR
jgi:plasmid stabilization system protein ParE